MSLPPACFGRATILHEVPKRISLALDMTTPGLVVLTDRWDPGWAAYLNGESVPILTADHALRGVVVPAGKGTLEFRYEPASFRLGLGLATLAVMVIGGAGFSGWWRSRRPGAAGGEASAPAGR